MVQQINGVNVSAAPFIAGVRVTMSSRDIAALTQKQHKHVVRDIETMLQQLGEKLEGYAHFWTHPQNNQQYREYRLDREHTECLVAGYSAPLRMAIIRRLRELEERAGAIPQTLPEALRLAADMAEQNARLNHKVQQDAPKVAFVEQYVEAGGAKSLRETAKILNMPEKAMIDVLLRDKVLFRQSGNLLPHALRQREGLFTVKTGTSDFGHAYTQTRVTPRGVQWMAERYASELMGGVNVAEHIQPLNRYYRDHHGIVVNVIGYDATGQRVIYRRPGYDWECVAPLIVFRSRFVRVDK